MTDCNGATIGVGDVVEVVDLHMSGEVESIHTARDRANVKVGGAVMWLKPSELRLVRRKDDNG